MSPEPSLSYAAIGLDYRGISPVTGSATARLLLYSFSNGHLYNICDHISPYFKWMCSQLYGSMIGTLWFVSKSRWRACLIHGAGTNKRSLLLSSSTPTHLSTCCFVGCRAKSAGNRGKEARVLESRSSEDALQHAWALPSSATENAQGVCAGSLSSMCVTAHPRRRLLGPLWQSWSLHSAGVVVSGFHRLHALPYLHRFRLGPAGAHVTDACDQSCCAPRTLPP